MKGCFKSLNSHLDDTYSSLRYLQYMSCTHIIVVFDPPLSWRLHTVKNFGCKKRGPTFFSLCLQGLYVVLAAKKTSPYLHARVKAPSFVCGATHPYFFCKMGIYLCTRVLMEKVFYGNATFQSKGWATSRKAFLALHCCLECRLQMYLLQTQMEIGLLVVCNTCTFLYLLNMCALQWLSVSYRYRIEKV